KASLISLIADGLVVVLFTPFFGLYGAVAGRVSATLVIFFYAFYELKKNIKIELDLQSLWKGALASVSLIIPLRLFERLISANYIDSPIITISIEILLGLVCYVSALFLLKALNKDDFRLLKQLMPKSLTKIITFFERLLIR
ncbi:hypothetical protein DRO66_02340, partial [Candidatus Bathyarchaeota archaeon]